MKVKCGPQWPWSCWSPTVDFSRVHLPLSQYIHLSHSLDQRNSLRLLSQIWVEDWHHGADKTVRSLSQTAVQVEGWSLDFPLAVWKPPTPLANTELVVTGEARVSSLLGLVLEQKGNQLREWHLHSKDVNQEGNSWKPGKSWPNSRGRRGMWGAGCSEGWYLGKWNQSFISLLNDRKNTAHKGFQILMQSVGKIIKIMKDYAGKKMR